MKEISQLKTHVSSYVFLVLFISTRILFGVWSSVVAGYFIEVENTAQCQANTTRRLLIPFCVIELMSGLAESLLLLTWIVDENAKLWVKSFATGIMNEIGRCCTQCCGFLFGVANLSLLIAISVFVWKDYDGCQKYNKSFSKATNSLVIANWVMNAASVSFILVASGVRYILTDEPKNEEETRLTASTA